MKEQNNGDSTLVFTGKALNVDSISSSILAGIFDNFLEAVIVADTDRQIIYANSKAVSLFGYSIDQLYGNKTKFLYAQKGAFSKQGDERFNTANMRSAENYKVIYRRADGETFLGLTTGAALRSVEKKVIGYIGIIRPARSAEQSLNTLQKVHAISSDLSTTYTEKIEQLLEAGLSHFGLDIAIQSRITDMEYLVENCIDRTENLTASTIFDLSETYCVHTLQADKAVGFHYVAESQIRDHPCYRNFELESYIGSAIKVNGKLYGTINFAGHSPTAPFSKDDYILIELLAETLSYIIYKKKLEEKLLTLAKTDELTGLPNRRETLHRLSKYIKLANRSESDLTILSIDLDSFKSINDKWGHEAGDAALIEFARIASTMGRETDFCGRIGGEEFILVLPNADSQAGFDIGNKLRKRLASEPIQVRKDQSIIVKVSIGVATLEDDESIETILTRADEAMYRAKKGGRDQVQVNKPQNGHVA